MTNKNLGIKDWILYFLLTLTGLLIMPNNIGSGAFDISLTITFIYFLCIRKIQWKRYWTEPILIAWLAYCAWLLVSGFFNTPFETFLYTLRKWPLRGLFSLIMLIELACSKFNQDRRFVFVLFILIFVWALAGGYFSFLIEQRWQTGKKFRPFEMHWNVTAKNLNLFIPLILVCFFVAKEKLYSYIFLILSLAGISGVLLSQSRSGIGGLLAGITLLLFILDTCNFRRKKIIIFLIVLLLTCVSLYGMGILDGLHNRMIRKDYISTSGRWDNVWPKVIKLILEKPWFGHQLMNFNQNISQIGGPQVGDAHNLFLHVVYDGGVIGLIFYLIFVYTFLRRSLRTAFFHVNTNFLILAVLCSFIIVWIIQGVVDYPSYYLTFLLISWFYFARENQNLILNNLSGGCSQYFTISSEKGDTHVD